MNPKAREAVIQEYCRELTRDFLVEVGALGYAVEAEEWRSSHLFGIRISCANPLFTQSAGCCYSCPYSSVGSIRISVASIHSFIRCKLRAAPASVA